MQVVRRGTRLVAVAGLMGLVMAAATPSAAVAAAHASGPTSVPAAAAGDAPAAVGDVVSYGGGDLQAVLPSRLLDTRLGVGAPKQRMSASKTIALKVTAVAGVPATGVGAVVLNITGVAPTTSTFLTVWPGGATRPTASSLNLAPGQTAPNLVVAKVGRGGIVNIYNRSGSLDVVADLTGWFPEGSGLQSLVPARALDTRIGVGGPRARVGAGKSLTLQLAGRAGLPSTGVAAVVVNLTGVAPTRSTYVTAWPAGSPRPATSTLNVDAAAVTPNLAVVKVGSGGRIMLYNYAGSIDLVADVVAWFPTSAAYRTVTPARILDTRKALGAGSAVGSGKQVAVQVTGRGGIPSTGVGAVVLNLTGISPTRTTYVTAWPAGVSRPTTSSLNLAPGAVRANLVMVQVGTGGKVQLYNNSGSTHLAGDVVGWFPTGTDDSVLMVPAEGTTLHGSGDLVALTGDAGAGGTVTFAPSSDLPAVGGHFAYQGGPAGGPGVSGVITDLTPKPDGSAVATYAPANLQDLFTDLDLHATGASAAGPAGTAGPAGPVGPGAAARVTGCEDAGGVGVSLPTATFKDLDADADFSLRHGTARFVVDGSLELKWGIAVEAGVSCDVTLASGLLAWIGPVALEWELTGGLSISGKLQAQTTVTMPVRVGFAHADGVTTNLSALDINGTATDDASLEATVEASLNGALFTKLFGVLGVSGGLKPGLTATWKPAHPLGCVELKGGISVTLAAQAGRWGLSWDWTLAEITLLEKTLYSSSGCSPGHWVGTIGVANDTEVANADFRTTSQITGGYTNLQLQVESGDRQSYEADVDVTYAGQGYVRCPDALGLNTTMDWSYSGPSSATVDADGNSLSWSGGTAFELWNRDDGTWFQPYHVSFNALQHWHCFAFGGPVDPMLQAANALSYAYVGLWEPTEPLVDDDPSPTHLVGTTTLSEPPGGGLDYTGYTYRITYDLTFIPTMP